MRVKSVEGYTPARGLYWSTTMNSCQMQGQASAICSMWSCFMSGSSNHSRDSAALCQVSDEPEFVRKLSSAGSAEATPVVVDVLSK